MFRVLVRVGPGPCGLCSVERDLFILDVTALHEPTDALSLLANPASCLSCWKHIACAVDTQASSILQEARFGIPSGFEAALELAHASPGEAWSRTEGPDGAAS
jgi:hypothetical protein